MQLLIAAAVLVGALALLNLMLTFGVIRRLREHTTQLSRLSGATPPFRDEQVGQPVPQFQATAADGTAVSRDSLLGRTRMVGFFSAGCEPCHEQAPEFAKWLSGQGGDTSEAVAVVTGAGPQADELATLLRDQATVVTEPDASRVADAFGVAGFPTFLRVDAEGVVTAADATMRGVVGSEAGLVRA